MSRISKDQVESSERFYRIPKIFTDETSYYYSMRLESKFAYALLRDRFDLSIKNNWVDEQNNVFLIYTVQNLGEILGCKKDKVNEIKKELIEYGLLEQVRQGLNLPNRLYVLNVDSNKKAEIKVDENPVVERVTEKPTPAKPVIARTSEFPPLMILILVILILIKMMMIKIIIKKNLILKIRIGKIQLKLKKQNYMKNMELLLQL